MIITFPPIPVLDSDCLEVLGTEKLFSLKPVVKNPMGLNLTTDTDSTNQGLCKAHPNVSARM